MNDTPESHAHDYNVRHRGGFLFPGDLDFMRKLERERNEARRLAEDYRDNDHDLTLQNCINNPPKPSLPWEQ